MRAADHSQRDPQPKPREARQADDATDKSQSASAPDHRPRLRAERKAPARAREDQEPAGATPPPDGKDLPPDAAKPAAQAGERVAEEGAADPAPAPAAGDSAPVANAVANAGSAAASAAAAAVLIDLATAGGAAQPGKGALPAAATATPAPAITMPPAASAPVAPGAAAASLPADAPPPPPALVTADAAAGSPIPAAMSQLLRDAKAELADRKMPAAARAGADAAASTAAAAAPVGAPAAVTSTAVPDLLQRLQSSADGVLDAAASAMPRPHVQAPHAAPALMPAVPAAAAALDDAIAATFTGALAAADAAPLGDKAVAAAAAPATDAPAIAVPTPPATASTTPAAAAPATFRLSHGLDTPEFSQALGERIAWLVDKDIGSAKLSINPPQLGPIDVHIEVSGDKAQVFLSAHSVVTRETLEAASPRLRDMLGAQGFTQVNVDVSQRSFQERGAPAPRQEWLPAVRDSTPAAVFDAGTAAARRAIPGALDAYA
jgi:flagellar hook-length control protein FliK